MRSVFLFTTMIVAALSYSPCAEAGTPAGPVQQVSPPTVPTVNPTQMGSVDVCKTSNSGGFANPVLSVTLGFGTTDQNCIMLKNARALNELGLTQAAIQLLCDDPKIAAAMDRAGTPCSAQKKVKQ